MVRIACGIGFGLSLVAGSALAQAAQSYTYDAQGRLTVVVRTGGGAGRTTTYSFDDADNRTQKVIVTSPALARSGEAADDTTAQAQAAAPSGEEPPAAESPAAGAPANGPPEPGADPVLP